MVIFAFIDATWRFIRRRTSIYWRALFCDRCVIFNERKCGPYSRTQTHTHNSRTQINCPCVHFVQGLIHLVYTFAWGAADWDSNRDADRKRRRHWVRPIKMKYTNLLSTNRIVSIDHNKTKRRRHGMGEGTRYRTQPIITNQWFIAHSQPIQTIGGTETK